MANVNEKCRSEIKNLLRNGNEVGEVIAHIQQKYKVTYNAAQKRVMNVRKSMNVGAKNTANTTPANNQETGMKPGEIATQQHSYNGKTNETTYKGLIAISPNDNVSKDYILEQYGLSKMEWRIVSFTMNEWQSQVKGGTTLNLQQFKLTVAPKQSEDFSPEDIQNIINDSIANVLNKNGAKIRDFDQRFAKVREKKDGYTVEISLPDIHVGLLSWRRETTEDFDLNIVYEQVMHAVTQIYNKMILMNIPIKKILLVTLGDVLHVDNDVQTTTKGTFQQVDGRFPKIVETAYDLLFAIITKFAQLAPVEYIYIPGNHDKDTGWQLAFNLSKVFEQMQNIRVTCDCEPNPHKYRIIGKVALGWTHGDARGKNLDGLMNMLIRGHNNIEYKCLHAGHLHSSHSHTSVDGGCYVENLDSLCPASLWEHTQAYGKTPMRYVTAFLWDGTPTPPDRIVGAVASK